MELIQRVHARNLVAWARQRPEVVVLSADLTSSTEIDLFRDTYPDRFFSMGMAEQNMMGFAGGLAREGFTPFVHTFGVFLYRRALDQISMSIAYPNLPVRMFGFLPGITTPGGATHQAIDDIGVLRVVPNMTILEAGDATDVESVLDVAQAVAGPVYVRMIRGEIPRLFDPAEPMRLGRARPLTMGDDIAVLSSGICTEEAMRAVRVLGERGVAVRHLHVTTLKPFDDPAVLEAISAVRHGVVTLENHTIIGGLGSAVAEVMAEAGLGKRLLRLGLRDRYAHGASRRYLMRENGLDGVALVAGIAEMMASEDLAVTQEELDAVELPVFESAKDAGMTPEDGAKAEDL
jgi:transketolase